MLSLHPFIARGGWPHNRLRYVISLLLNINRVELKGDILARHKIAMNAIGISINAVPSAVPAAVTKVSNTFIVSSGEGCGWSRLCPRPSIINNGEGI
jgi:hypothetical protein